MRIWLLFVAAVFSIFGCAKYPSTVNPNATRLIFRMTVRGQIRSDYVYVFPIHTTMDANPTTLGPIPVVAFPNANGFVAGDVEYFVVWTPDTQQYTLYKFNDASLTTFTAIGVPINTLDVTSGSKTLGFDLSLEQLVTTPGTSTQLMNLQVNFLTMNFRLTPGTNPNSRIIDCLGNTNSFADLNEPVKIPLTTSGVYDNTRFNFIEPVNSDCPDPDLDITDWSVEVQRPQ